MMIKRPNDLIIANLGKLFVKAGLMASSILKQFCPCHVLQFVMLQEIIPRILHFTFYIDEREKREMT